MDSIVFNMAQMHRHGSAFYDFLRLRKTFFVDQLHWDIPHDGEVEMDQYDNPTAWYSLVLRDGEVVGGARAMPTTARWGDHTYMLRDVATGRLSSIPSEIVVDAVATPRVWECTRVVVSDELSTQAERAECLSTLVEGIVDVASRHGASELMCLSRVTLVRALRQLGYACERRGEPYVEPSDGRQYAVLAMPARSATANGVMRPAHAARAGRAGVPSGHAMATPTHLSNPTPVHAPSVA